MKKDSFAKKLAGYIAMSSAFLAAQKECDAQIVYTNVNPDAVIGNGNFTESYFLDLNGDGINDFELVNIQSVFTSTTSWGTYTSTWNSNAFSPLNLNMMAATSSSYIIENFLQGDTINANQNWINNTIYGPGFGGNAEINGFVGLELKKNNHTYFGWVRLYSPNGADYLAVKDYAYNSIADEPIIAGETSCDSMLLPPILVWNGTEIQSSGNGTPQWFLNGDTLSGYNANNISPPLIGSYNVIYSDTLGCHSQSHSFYYLICDSLNAVVSSGNDSVCYNQHPVVNALPANSSLYYQWQNNNLNFGSNSIGLYSTPTNLFAGINNFRVIISSSLMGCSDTSTLFSIYEFPIVVPTISINGDTMISSPAMSYSWRNSNNQVVGTSQNYFPTSSGMYRVFVINDFGCSGYSSFAYFDYCWYLNNSVQNLGDELYCPGALIYDSLITVYNPDYLYQWYLNWTLINGAISNIYVATTTGNFNVNIIDTNTNCFVNSDAVSLAYTNLPAPSIYQTNDTLYTQSGLFAYQWYLNSQPISGATNWFYVLNVSGNYSVSAFNQYNCEGTSLSGSYSNCAIGNQIIHSTGDTHLCPGESTTLYVPFAANNLYQWMKNGIIIQGAINSSLIVDTSGDYYVLIYDSSAVCFYNSPTITTIAFPYVPVVIYQSGDSLISSVAAPFYAWFHNNAYISSSNQKFYLLPSNPSGYYYVKLVDSNGCENYSSYIYFAPNGIQNINSEEYKFYTDRKTIYITLKDDRLLGSEIIICNLLGQKIYAGEIKNETLQLNLNNASGMNFLIIRKGDYFSIEKIILN